MAANSLLPAYIAIGVSAILPIYFGSHASVKMPKSAKRAAKALNPAKEIDDDLDEEVDRVTSREAYLFPILGSATLTALFLAFKYLDKNLINKLFSAYFALVGTAGLARLFIYVTRRNISKELFSSFDTWKIDLTKGKSSLFWISWSSIEFTTIPLAMALTAYHLYTNNWIAANLLALSFCFNGISLLKLDSFATGAIVLVGLFVYDIYWVFYSSKQFGQSVMVAVATNFEAPIKIVFPKNFFDASSGFSMLGLGDIVIPGIFIALALRFDYGQALSKAVKAKVTDLPTPRERYAQPYFYTCFAFYIIGLATTIIIMHTYRAAQPALLYLSPACLLAIAGTAAVRGELKAAWNFVDDDTESKTQTISSAATESEDKKVASGTDPADAVDDSAVAE